MSAKLELAVFQIAVFSAVILAALSLPAWTESAIEPFFLGAAAPPLDVVTIKGDPVDLAAGKGASVHVVEFWATWCGPCRTTIPHLTDLQAKYGPQGLKVVGISDEDVEVIRPFVAEMGSRMNYTVAADNGQSTVARYMGAAGVNSIPYAFVVDKAGRLAWHGHPLDAGFEKAIATALAKGDAAGSGAKSEGSDSKR